MVIKFYFNFKPQEYHITTLYDWKAHTLCSALCASKVTILNNYLKINIIIIPTIKYKNIKSTIIKLAKITNNPHLGAFS